MVTCILFKDAGATRSYPFACIRSGNCSLMISISEKVLMVLPLNTSAWLYDTHRDHYAGEVASSARFSQGWQLCDTVAPGPVRASSKKSRLHDMKKKTDEIIQLLIATKYFTQVVEQRLTSSNAQHYPCLIFCVESRTPI